MSHFIFNMFERWHLNNVLIKNKKTNKIETGGEGINYHYNIIVMLWLPIILCYSLFEILQTLYFAIFGLIDVKNFELEEDHQFTQFVGKLMFGTYNTIMIVVLLNMLIAMLSNSYQYISVSTQ